MSRRRLRRLSCFVTSRQGDQVISAKGGCERKRSHITKSDGRCRNESASGRVVGLAEVNEKRCERRRSASVCEGEILGERLSKRRAGGQGIGIEKGTERKERRIDAAYARGCGWWMERSDPDRMRVESRIERLETILVDLQPKLEDMHLQIQPPPSNPDHHLPHLHHLPPCSLPTPIQLQQPTTHHSPSRTTKERILRRIRLWRTRLQLTLRDRVNPFDMDPVRHAIDDPRDLDIERVPLVRAVL